MTIQANFPAIKPSLMLDFANTKQLDSRITYTRASTASYYDGVTTSKAEENLLIRSAEFDNATWGKTRSTVTANAVAAPDGTTTAESLDQASGQTSSGLASQYLVLTANSHVFSVFAKANTKSKIFLRDDFNGARSTWFDLSAGTVGTTNAGHTASITSVGSSWYRCVIVFTSTAQNNQVIVGLADTDNSTTVTDSGGVYVWGAQLEQRSAVSAYTATTTQAITNYIPKLQSAASGVARFDNNPTTGESLGLLIEESRTNLITYSSQFDNAAWTKGASSITADTIVAPDGTLTGDKLVDTATSATHRLEQTQTVTNGASYTISVFAKAAERSWLAIYEDSGPSNWAFFNLTTGAVGTVNAGTSTITPVGNGWYRCTLTYTQVGTSGRVRIAVSTGNTTFTYTGDGYSGIYIWGAQFEAGAFATSYIPTVASQVTRANEAASMTGTNFSSWYNSGEGTLYAEGFTANTSTTGIVSINDNTGNNRIDMRLTLGTGVGSSFISVNGTNQALFTSNATANTQAKQVVAYKVDDFAFCRNAGTVQTDTSGTIPTLVTQMRIGTLDGATNNTWFLGGSIKKIAYYPIRVTNAQLQALTS